MPTTFTKQVTRLKDRFSPCSEAVSWLNNGFKTPQQAWEQCERGDWLLWLLGRLSGEVGSKSRKKLVKACCACARLVLPIYEKKYPNDNRARNCLDITEAYSHGQATLEQVKEARSADAADAADAAAAAYAYAADAAVYAAAYAAYAAAAAASAAYAYAAYAADAVAAGQRVRKQCADEVRKIYPKVPRL